MIEGVTTYARPFAWTLVPADSETAPLMLCLHGYRQDREQALNDWGELKGRVHLLVADGPLVHECGRRPRRIGHAWYVYDGDRERLEKELRITSQALDDLIGQASKEIKVSELWLGGFSQGGYMALYYSLQHNRDVCRLHVVGGNLHASLMPDELQGLNVDLHHGEHDEDFSLKMMTTLETELQQRGAVVKRQSFDCAHEVIPKMIDVFINTG